MAIKQLSCANCSAPIYLDELTVQRRREDGQGFYCPNGHSNVFQPSENDRLKKTIAEKDRALEYLRQRNKELWNGVQALRRSITGYKGQLGRMRSKIKALELELEEPVEEQVEIEAEAEA
jgi:predicted RNase H-like nuclease (RuvC/YqgF family)